MYANRCGKRQRGAMSSLGTRLCQLQVAGLLVLLLAPGVWSGENGEECASVLKEDGTDGVLSRVKSTLFSVGYAGIDSLNDDLGSEASAPICTIRSARMINKAGEEVAASAYSAQAAVRSFGVKLAGRSQCPMLGFCADIMDASSTDSWPITTLTWIIIPLQSEHSKHHCGKMKLLQDYARWILFDEKAQEISQGHHFGVMPGLLASEFMNLVDKMKCSGPGEPEFVKDRNSSADELEGAGSSLQGHLQSSLANEFYLQFGKSINYKATSSGDGQRQLSAQKVDFAGSDAYLNISLPGLDSRQFRMIPIFAAAVGIVFNRNHLGDELVLTREEVSAMFLGQKEGWPTKNETETKPAVLRVVRGDRSGTTESFAKALYYFSGADCLSDDTSRSSIPDYNLHPLQGSSLPTWPVAKVPYSNTTVCSVRSCSNVQCSPGERLDEAAGTCVDCPKESYIAADLHQISKCLPCKPGTFAPNQGSSECMPCTAMWSLEIQGNCIAQSTFFSALLVPTLLVLGLCLFALHIKTMKGKEHLLIISPEELIFADPPHILGAGACGVVLRAEFRGTFVAIKRVIPSNPKPSTHWDSNQSEESSTKGRDHFPSLNRPPTPLHRAKRGLSLVFEHAILPASPETPTRGDGRLSSTKSLKSSVGAAVCFSDDAYHNGEHRKRRSSVHFLGESSNDAGSTPNSREQLSSDFRLPVVHALEVQGDDLRFQDLASRIDQNRDAWSRTANGSCNATESGSYREEASRSPSRPDGGQLPVILKKPRSCSTTFNIDIEKGATFKEESHNHFERSHSSHSRRSDHSTSYSSFFLETITSSSTSSVMSFMFFSKKSKAAHDQRHRRREFRREIEILSRLRHPCIVTVMGAVKTSHLEPVLVMECMDLGSLHDLLHNESFFLEGELLLPMLSDVAQGMRFLHAAVESIIHGDLKAGNVLVDSNFRAKVADFGLSSKRRSSVHGTPAFMAPEVLRGDTGLTKENDVYAFGIILYEAFARKNPYQGENWDIVRAAIVDSSPDAPLKRPPVPKGCPALVIGLMQECWHRDAASRPTFDEIDRRIRALDIGCVTSQALEAAKKHQQRGSSVETVLFDMFPSHVAEALMHGKKVPPEEKEMVTVYFSDIVSFTNISSTISSSKVSDLLDRLYLKFDELAHKHKVYKIETIGDSYIAVTNLFSDQAATHAATMARFAVEVEQAACSTLIDSEDPEKGSIQIRIGLHSGPVVASVIGNKIPKYTLLGDTMNTASRMESNSQPGKIQCTKECAELILAQDEANGGEGAVRVVRRGVMEIKGKGLLETYWIQPPAGSSRML